LDRRRNIARPCGKLKKLDAKTIAATLTEFLTAEKSQTA